MSLQVGTHLVDERPRGHEVDASERPPGGQALVEPPLDDVGLTRRGGSRDAQPARVGGRRPEAALKRVAGDRPARDRDAEFQAPPHDVQLQRSRGVGPGVDPHEVAFAGQLDSTAVAEALEQHSGGGPLRGGGGWVRQAALRDTQRRVLGGLAVDARQRAGAAQGGIPADGLRVGWRRDRRQVVPDRLDRDRLEQAGEPRRCQDLPCEFVGAHASDRCLRTASRRAATEGTGRQKTSMSNASILLRAILVPILSCQSAMAAATSSAIVWPSSPKGMG